jgi:cyclase
MIKQKEGKMNKVDQYYSRHFSIEQVADSVFAVINNEEGWAICNAGIIDLGDRTLVYDTFTSPQAASDLRQAAESLIGRPVWMVINSHYHNDHIWGNQAFGSEVDIISTTKTRDLILTEGAEEIKGCKEVAPQRLAALEAQYAESGDESFRHDLKPLIYDYQAIVNALPILQVRLPNLTFTGDMIFNGHKRSAKLMSYENGHCGSDAILYLPEDGIVFMEDILFNGCHPYLGDGDPDVIQRILAQVKLLNASIFVPGHGPVGGIEHLDILAGYITKLNILAKEAVQRGISEGELDQVTIPDEYQHFIFSTFFAVNLRFMYHRQLKQ